MRINSLQIHLFLLRGFVKLQHSLFVIRQPTAKCVIFVCDTGGPFMCCDSDRVKMVEKGDHILFIYVEL